MSQLGAASSLLSASPEGPTCAAERGGAPEKPLEAAAPLSYSDQRALLSRAGKENGLVLASCASSHGNSSSKNTETRLLFGPVSRGLGLKPGQGAAAQSGTFSVSVSRTATCTAGSLLPTASAKASTQEPSAAQMDSKTIKLQKLQVCRGPRPLRGRE